MINSDKILFIPSIRHGNGTGHLRRCLEWSSELKKAHYYLPSEDKESAIDLKNHPLIKKTANLVRHDSEKELKQIDWKLIVLDNRTTYDVPSVLNKIPVIAIDETGPFRQRASYVLDILPSRKRKQANNHVFSFLNFPEKIRSIRPLKKILISFGGEDPGNLSQKILDSLDKKLLENYEWSVILPHRGNTEAIPNQVQCLHYVEDLKNQLHHYDLVITSYGLTALEALASQVFVLLFNPGSYHDQLSRNFRIPYCPRGFKKNKRQLNQYLNHAIGLLNEGGESSFKSLWSKMTIKHQSLLEWLEKMTISSESCPVCGSMDRKVIGRFEFKSYFICTNCSMKYMVQFMQKSDIYSKDYFFSEYKKQYGKTYLEDFPHIQKMGEERLDRIPIKAGKILDIGCAYGPFLLKAAERGFSAWGLEISEEAVSHIQENYPQINIHQGSFENLDIHHSVFSENQFDVITMWYVIEHFDDLKSLLPKLNSLLKEGGILALSTPHASGISGQFNLQNFLKNSPEDHFTLWDRKSAVKALKLHGFRSIRFHVTGHHPERFPLILKKILTYNMRKYMSILLGWGDTFEIYAKKGK